MTQRWCPAACLVLVTAAVGGQPPSPGSPREEATLTGHAGAVRQVAFSPDGKLPVAGGDNPGVMSLWDVPARRLRWRVSRHRNTVMSIRFSPDGRAVASGSMDRSVRLWAPGTGESKQLLAAGKDVLAVAFLADGRTLAVSGPAAGPVRALARPAPPDWGGPGAATPGRARWG
jgi:WD40 repeat protein